MYEVPRRAATDRLSADSISNYKTVINNTPRNEEEEFKSSANDNTGDPFTKY